MKTGSDRWYSAPSGCGYHGEDRPATWVMNRINLGDDMQCLTRVITDPEQPFYSALLNGYPRTGQG